MSKSLILSIGLALSFCGMSKAGLFDNCSTCGIASPQGVVAPSAQSYVSTGCDTGCDTGCKPKHKLSSLFHHKPKMYTYEYVLKKKRVFGHHKSGCDDCGGVVTSPVYASGQYGSPQAAPYAAPQATGAPQTTSYLPGAMTPAIASTGDVPPPPEIAPASNGSLSLTPAGN